MVDIYKQGGVGFTYKAKTHSFRLSKSVDAPYQVVPRAMFGASILTGEADYTNMRPDEVVPLVRQNDFTKGFQDEDYRDAKRYAHSVNCDARDGRVLLSPKQLTGLSFPESAATTVPVPNGAFEDWPTGSVDGSQVTPSGWTNASGTAAYLECDTGNKHAGTYCVGLTKAEDGSPVLELNFPWTNDLRGKVLTVTCWMKEAADGALSGSIYDGVDTTTTNATSTSMAQYTIVHTFNAAATQFRLRFTETTNLKTSYVDDVTMTRSTTPFGTVKQIIDFGGVLVVAAGSTLLKSTDGVNLTTVCDFLTTITHMEIKDSNLYILTGVGNTMFYTSNLSTFYASYGQGSTSTFTTTTAAYTAASTTIDVGATGGFVAGNYLLWDTEVVKVSSVTDADTLVIVRAQQGTSATGHASGSYIYLMSATNGGAYAGVYASNMALGNSASTVVLSDNPVNNGTPFSTAIQVGNDDYDITYIAGDGAGNLFVRKEDSVFSIEDDAAIEVVPDIRSEVNTSVAYPMEIWKGWLFIPAGINSLYRYNISSQTVEDISLGQYAQGDGDMDGQVLSMCWDAHYFYVAVLNGTKVELLAGRDETIDGDTAWIWHPLWEITEDDLTAMCVSGVTGKKSLYAGTDVSSNGILKFTLPQAYSDNLIEVSFQATASGSFVTPWYTTSFVENDKYWDSVWVAAFNFSQYTGIKVSYQVEGDGVWTSSDNWTELGNCSSDDSGSISDNGTTRTLVYPKEQVTRFSIAKTSRKVRFKLDLTTALDGSSTDEVSPVVTRIRVDGRVEASLAGVSLRRKNIICMLALADSVNDNWSSLADSLASLSELEEATEPIDFEGPDCKNRKVRFAHEGLTTKIVRQSAESKSAEFVAVLTLEEI